MTTPNRPIKSKSHKQRLQTAPTADLKDSIREKLERQRLRRVNALEASEKRGKMR
jgi:hypothetical protein